MNEGRSRDMQVWRAITDAPSNLDRTVVTIGNFDGMHLGHQRVVGRARELATDLAVDTLVAVTFDPHPIALLQPEHAPARLTTIDQRLELMAKASVDVALVIPFTHEVAEAMPEDFVESILVRTLRAKAVVVGADFRFGHRAAGDCRMLRRAGAHHDFVLEDVALRGGPQVWSSTYIRACLAAGDVASAAEALGRPFTTRGVLVHEGQRPDELDLAVPGVHVILSRGAGPAAGDYAGRVTPLDQTGARNSHPAAITVAATHTIRGETHTRIVARLLDQCALPAHEVEVEFATPVENMARTNPDPILLKTHTRR